MSSSYIASKDDPGPDEIPEALREATSDSSQFTDMPCKEVARQLVLYGHLQEEPSPALVAGMLGTLEAEENSFDADRPSEESTHENMKSTSI